MDEERHKPRGCPGFSGEHAEAEGLPRVCTRPAYLVIGQRVARLAELSRKARRGQVTAEELQELDRLEEPPASGTL
jgi:hypothetical protein